MKNQGIATTIAMIVTITAEALLPNFSNYIYPTIAIVVYLIIILWDKNLKVSIRNFKHLFDIPEHGKDWRNKPFFEFIWPISLFISASLVTEGQSSQVSLGLEILIILVIVMIYNRD